MTPVGGTSIGALTPRTIDHWSTRSSHDGASTYPFVRPDELDRARSAPHPVIVVGGGLSGLTMALDLVRRGQRVTLLDDDNTVGVRGLASRGMVWARTLDLRPPGRGRRHRRQGVRWNVGRVLCRDAAVASFTLQAQPDMRHNGFVNLQQYYLEAFLVEALQREPLAELRWLNRVDAIDSPADGGPVTCACTPEGDYRTQAEWVIACDGANSPLRQALGLRPECTTATKTAGSSSTWCCAVRPGRKSADLAGRRQQPRPAVWRHKMADDTWRLDFQLRPDETRRPPARRRPCASASGTCWANRSISISPGTASGPIATNACPACVMAACCSPATRRTWWRRSARAATAASRTPTTWAGNWRWCCRDAPATRCSTATAPSASTRRWRTSARRGARRAGIPARPNRRACGATPSSRWPAPRRARARINTGRLCMPAIYPPSPLAHPASPHAGRALPNVVLDRRAQLTAPAARPLVHRPGLRRPRTGHPEPAADDALLRRVTVGAHCDAEGREALRRQLGVEMNGEVWLIRPDQHVMAAVDAAASRARLAPPCRTGSPPRSTPAPTRVPGRALPIECRSPRPCPCRSRSLTICSNV